MLEVLSARHSSYYITLVSLNCCIRNYLVNLTLHDYNFLKIIQFGLSWFCYCVVKIMTQEEVRCQTNESECCADEVICDLDSVGPELDSPSDKGKRCLISY